MNMQPYATSRVPFLAGFLSSAALFTGITYFVAWRHVDFAQGWSLVAAALFAALLIGIGLLIRRWLA